ncbi:MAG: hypothetical protein WC947_10885 [Elusimicrobiota bacterium]
MNITLCRQLPFSILDFPKKEHPEISGCCNAPISISIERSFSQDKFGNIKLEGKKKTFYCTKCTQAFPAYNLVKKNVAER